MMKKTSREDYYTRLFFSPLILPPTPKSSTPARLPRHRRARNRTNRPKLDHRRLWKSHQKTELWSYDGLESEGKWRGEGATKSRATIRERASVRARSSFFFFFFSASERRFCCAATHALPANKHFSAVTGPSGRRRSPPVVGPHPPTARVRHSCPTHPPPGSPGVRPRLLHPYLINPSWTPHSSLVVPDFSGRLPFLPPSPALSFAIYSELVGLGR